jgi:membrane protein YdbS with pleckstrin-like domain
MGYPDNLLVQGERVIVNKRPHWKVLILPTILFIVIIAAGAALATWISKSNWDSPQWAYYTIIAVALVALIILVLVPFVRWRTEHFVITNHHVFFRTGLLSRREHQIPLGQIANMETEVTFWGRLMGYGSLIVESSADQPLKFRNVASLSKVQAQLNQLIRDERERTHRGPDRGPGAPEQGYQQPQGYQPGYPQQYVAPQQDYPQQGYPPQGYPQQGYPAGQPPQGYQPTQAYQQPPGYPPPGYATPAQGSPAANPPTSPTSIHTPPPGSAQDDGRPPQQS